MTKIEKRQWRLMFYFVITFLLLCYAKRLFTYFEINAVVKLLSIIIVYGGVIFLIAILVALYYFKKQYKTSNKEIWNDKELRVLFLIILVLGVGNLLMNI